MVEDTIGQLLSISNDDQQAQGGQQSQQSGQQGGQEQPAAVQAQQAEPQSIQKGMTTDQVEAALGKPEQKVDLGTKQIYVYKTLKVSGVCGR